MLLYVSAGFEIALIAQVLTANIPRDLRRIYTSIERNVNFVMTYKDGSINNSYISGNVNNSNINNFVRNIFKIS